MTERVRLLTLYPDELNIYADRGNLLFLRKRCEWRGIEFEAREAGPGESFSPEEADVIYIGGGQDRDQEAVGADLLETKEEAVTTFVEMGKPLLAVCGGFQLLGRRWSSGDGEEREGLGVFDVSTERGTGKRLIGAVAVEANLLGERLLVAGFENHAGRTRLGSEATPFGTVIAGYGNNGEDGTEGVLRMNSIGTYLHGPLLPKNPRLADLLLALALSPNDPNPPGLAPLEDSLEMAAHQEALDAALRSRKNRNRRSRARTG